MDLQLSGRQTWREKRLRIVCFCLLLLPLLFSRAVDGNDLEELRAIQARIQNVVTEMTPVSVVVTDGIGSGSGVIVSADGLVLTASHVLETDGNNWRVIFPDGRQVKAKPLGKNLNVDAAMLKITEAGPWPYAELGEITAVRCGDWCVCLGHSGGYEIGRNPPVRAGRVLDFEPDQIVTDCALIGGDSGGPVFDLDGKVIAINSSIGSSIAENRHVSIAAFKRYWERMQKGDSWGRLPDLSERGPKRPAMGIRVDRMDEVAVITKVHDGGSAQKAGLKVGDVVETFAGVTVTDPQMLIDLIKQKYPGDVVTLTVLRGEDRFEVTLELQEQTNR